MTWASLTWVAFSVTPSIALPGWTGEPGQAVTGWAWGVAAVAPDAPAITAIPMAMTGGSARAAAASRQVPLTGTRPEACTRPAGLPGADSRSEQAGLT